MLRTYYVLPEKSVSKRYSLLLLVVVYVYIYIYIRTLAFGRLVSRHRDERRFLFHSHTIPPLRHSIPRWSYAIFYKYNLVLSSIARAVIPVVLFQPHIGWCFV